MKVPNAVVCVLVTTAAVKGFSSPSKSFARHSLQLEAQHEKGHASVGTAFAAAVAGWSIASQAVFASVMPLETVDYTPPSYGSSIEIAARTETMDFSMPSYDSFGDDSSKAKKADSAPSFNPFGDFQPGFADSDKKLDEEKAAQTAAADKAAARAAAEAEAATKKAEKEARLKAEKEKQEAVAAARAKAASETPVPNPQTPSPAPASSPSPQFEMPEIKVPDVDFKAPDFSGLKLNAPKIDLPKVDIPKFDTPVLSVPKVDIPQVSIPKVAMPSFGGGESKSSSDAPLASREVRDEKARQAKQAYVDADQAAKEVEAKAREARNFANSQKQAAKEARDLACVDRPGGKFLCLRNPFSTGF